MVNWFTVTFFVISISMAYFFIICFTFLLIFGFIINFTLLKKRKNNFIYIHFSNTNNIFKE